MTKEELEAEKKGQEKQLFEEKEKKTDLSEVKSARAQIPDYIFKDIW
jgi:hypothetical protein